MNAGFGERAWGHVRAAFTSAEWRIPLYTRAGQPSGLTYLKTTIYSTAQLQWREELLSKAPHRRPQRPDRRGRSRGVQSNRPVTTERSSASCARTSHADYRLFSGQQDIHIVHVWEVLPQNAV